MSAAYDPARWHDFAVCLGGAAAALAGLLFVAMTLRLESIVQRPRSRGNATGTFLTLFALLAVAIIVLIPGQSTRLLGSEIAIVGGGILAFDLSMELSTGHSWYFLFGGSRPLHNGGLALLFFCGVALAAGRLGGLFLLPGAVLVLLAAVFLGSWRLILGLVEAEADQSGAGRRVARRRRPSGEPVTGRGERAR